MKNIWILTINNIKRNKMGVFLSIGGAVLLCMMLTMLGNMESTNKVADIAVGVIDYDKSILSQDLKDYLTDSLHYQLIEHKNFDQLSAQLIDKTISVIIEVPVNFYDNYVSGNTKKLIVTSLDDYENAAYVKVYINSYLSSINVLSVGAGGDKRIFEQLLADYNKKNIKITQTSAVVIDKKSYGDQMGFINSMGFFLMFIFAISVIIAFMIPDDRFHGVYNRIQITPVKPIQYIIGTGIFGLILSVIMIGIYCSYIGVRKIHTGLPLPMVILLMVLFSVFTICFSIAIAVILLSKNAMSSIVIGFATIGCILGGAYFPIDLAPQTMQNLAKALPQYWFMDTIRRLQADSHANIYPNLTIIALFALLCMLIGAVSFSQNYKTK